MKLAIASALSLATLLTACTTTSTQPSHVDKAEKADYSYILASELKNYRWAYQPSGTQEPIVLHFEKDQLHIDTGCNTMATTWEAKEQHLVVGEIMTTLKGCSAALTQQEGFAAGFFQNKNTPFTVDIFDRSQPILTLTHTDGKDYKFIGTDTPEHKYQSQPDIIFMEVAAETKTCTGVAVQQCLQVREIKYNESFSKSTVGDWQLFYGNIEGFKHDPNVRTVLRLKRFTIAKPAADQSKYAYVHDLTVEQELVK